MIKSVDQESATSYVVVPLAALNEFLDKLVPFNTYGYGDANVGQAVTKFCQSIQNVSPDSIPTVSEINSSKDATQ